MLKFIILLVLLFLYIRKDRYEGIDNITSSDTEGETKPSKKKPSEKKPSGKKPSEITSSSEIRSSSNEKLASLETKLEFDSKIFDYLIGGGAGFFVGLGVGIVYHIIHTEDDSSPSS